ncbi:hypothetical protein V1478_003874 [Vespula squamosa]|uniref:Uncharacterized protein n=1 Tax=Vespula squamosa TaxID=30214 RepID=A0ABD2BN22_VESSQ
MKINRGSGKSLPSLSMLPKKDCGPRGGDGGDGGEPPVICITLSMASPHLAKTYIKGVSSWYNICEHRPPGRQAAAAAAAAGYVTYSPPHRKAPC